MKSFNNWIKEWKETIRFLDLPKEKRKLVFYSEGLGTTPHLRPIIASLIEDFNYHMCFLTSDRRDILFKNPNSHVNTFFIGDGASRTFLFPRIESKVLVTTTPNIQSKQLKKSKSTHYIYTNHSPVSTHMVYQENAFDNFDTILCCGLYQVKEIRERELSQNLKAKNLLKSGLPKLDSLLKITKERSKQPANENNTVLIAPSWGPNSIIENCGKELINSILNINFKVKLRPHNMTWRNSEADIKNLENIFSSNPNFSIDKNIDSVDSILESHVLISDWSGIAIEYAFGLQKPILFIDLPPKVNNQNYKNISLIPLEESIRSDLGEIIPLDKVNDSNYLKTKLILAKQKTNQHKELGKKYIYNLGESSKESAKQIIEILKT